MGPSQTVELFHVYEFAHSAVGLGGVELHDALEAGKDNDIFAILARPAFDWDFEYNGKTYTPQTFAKDALFGNITEKDLPFLENATGIELAKTAVQYSDGVILGSDAIAPQLTDYCKELGLPILSFDESKIESGAYVDDYNSFYDQL